MWHIYTMEYCSASKKKEIPSFVTIWMNPKGIILSEISQVWRHKYHIISHLYVEAKNVQVHRVYQWYQRRG
jgi:hypothetical protein